MTIDKQAVADVAGRIQDRLHAVSRRGLAPRARGAAPPGHDAGHPRQGADGARRQLPDRQEPEPRKPGGVLSRHRPCQEGGKRSHHRHRPRFRPYRHHGSPRRRICHHNRQPDGHTPARLYHHGAPPPAPCQRTRGAICDDRHVRVRQSICDANDIHFEDTFTGFKFMAESWPSTSATARISTCSPSRKATAT